MDDDSNTDDDNDNDDSDDDNKEEGGDKDDGDDKVPENNNEIRSRTSSLTNTQSIAKQNSVEFLLPDSPLETHSDDHSHSDNGRRHSLRHRKDGQQENTILTYEIVSNGESSYCHRSMRNLYIYMLKSSQKHDTASKSDDKGNIAR
jgi:hypothetical protein